MDSVDEEGNEYEFVIVGAGIGGLATALALHRKGFKNVAVYEKSESLRAEGSAIGIFSNGWRALDQLGVGPQLRDKAILLQGGWDIWVDQGKHQKIPFPTGEARCLKRKDLIDALANALPPKAVQFGCKVVAVKMDSQSMSPTLQLYDDDKAVRAKGLIGCDGSNSIVADFLGLKPTRLFTLCAVRGLTTYPNGHLFAPELVRMKRNKGDKFMVGRIPVDNKLVYWFVVLPLSWLDGKFPDDPEDIKQSTLSLINGYPTDAVEMIGGSDLDSLSFTHLRYRSPWEILVGKFHKGSAVTVAGDAMHAMGPFLGQGGSAALEDAVVLARNLEKKTSIGSQLELEVEIERERLGKQIMSGSGSGNGKIIREAFDEYVEERRMRVLRLSTQAYLTGVVLGSTSSLTKFIAIAIMAVLFRDRTGHTKYDCGRL